MEFKVSRVWGKPSADGGYTALLKPDNWDDHGFKTTFELSLVSSEEVIEIGNVSIAYEGMEYGRTSTEMPKDFDELPQKFFSLGIRDEYYWNLKRLGDDVRKSVLRGLNDLALDVDRFNSLLENSNEDSVINRSFLRHNSLELVRQQLHRIAHGGPRFLEFEMSMSVAYENCECLEFRVEPESYPPSNVHALIGSNGVGKTHLISEIVNGVSDGDTVQVESQEGDFNFLNVVLVAFSPFDWGAWFDSEGELSYDSLKFIGLAKGVFDVDDKLAQVENKNHEELKSEFADYIEKCKQQGKLSWLRIALSKLETDPLLAANETYLQASRAVDVDPEQLADEFSELSSGHKIVLLTVTALAAEVDEGTLVLVDEPENHLHPPLLSSFVRALSELLYDRNGLAIVGTHSPVVLQEIPRSCVWKIYRSGDSSKAERPLIETFGENVGVLTREVFGLQVRESGFYQMLADAVDQHGSYEEVLKSFGGQLGGEAKSLVRVLIASKG